MTSMWNAVSDRDYFDGESPPEPDDLYGAEDEETWPEDEETWPLDAWDSSWLSEYDRIEDE